MPSSDPRRSTSISAHPQLSRNEQDLVTILGYDGDVWEGFHSPHIQYIVRSCPRDGSKDEYIGLSAKVIKHFTQSEQGGQDTRSKCTLKRCIDELVCDVAEPYFRHIPLNHPNRQDVISDNVLIILGSWTMIQEYFRLQNGQSRRILSAYCCNNGKPYSETLGLDETLEGLLGKSGLLPHPEERVTFLPRAATETLLLPEADEAVECTEMSSAIHPSLAMESLEIPATALNALKLANLGAVRIRWTNNVSRHMLLSNHARRFHLELFAMPSALKYGTGCTLKYAGITGDLMEEINASYAQLFSPKQQGAGHKYFGLLLGVQFWCFCLSCASRRLVKREIKKLKSTSLVPRAASSTDPVRSGYDATLKDLMLQDAGVWNQDDFKHLWPRIMALDTHLSESKPWSFWVIFRDRRDSVQFWTFLFGTMILFLTFVQVFLAIAQVASGFR